MKNKQRRTTENIRDDALKTINDLREGKITPEEANKISDYANEELKSYNRDLSSIRKNLTNNTSKKKNHTDYIIDVEVITDKKTEQNELSEEHKKIASNIKTKLRKTAELIVEIGTQISETVKNQPTKYKELFYEEIGMSKRSALRYQQIANNAKVQELQKNKQLEGKTMQDLIQLISTPQKTPSNRDIHKVAQGFYNKYKSEPDKLKAIIDELQELVKNSE